MTHVIASSWTRMTRAIALLTLLLLLGCEAPAGKRAIPAETAVQVHDGPPLDTGRFSDPPHFESHLAPSVPPPSAWRDPTLSLAEPLRGASGAWPLRLGGVEADKVKAMALGPDGQLVLGGTMRDQWDLAGDTLQSPALGGSAGLVMSFAPDGSPQWGRVLGSVDGHTGVDDVAVSPTGRIVACGGKQKPLTHGNITQDVGGHGVFLAEWTSDGTPTWLHAFAGSLHSSCGAMAIEQSVQLDTVGHTVAAFVHDGRLQLVRVNQSGTLELHVAHGHGLKQPAVGLSAISGLTTDGHGGVWVTGVVMANGLKNVGGEDWSVSGSSAIFLAKYDIGTGAHLWSNAWGSPGFYSVAGFDRPTGLTAMGEEVFLTGRSLPGIDFGTGALGGAPEGNKNVGFLVAFELTGEPRWVWAPKLEEDGDHVAVGALSGTQDGDLALLLGNHVMRVNPSDGWSYGVEPVTPGAHSLLIDGEGEAVLAYTLYNTKTFGEWVLTSAGHADIVIDRMAIP